MKTRGYVVSRQVPNGFKNTIVREKSAELVSDYLAGIDTHKLAKKYECSRCLVSRILKEAGVEKRGPRQACTNRRECDPALFEEEPLGDIAAYFIGLLLTDGCVKSLRYSVAVSLVLAEPDRFVVDKLKEVLSFDGEPSIQEPRGRMKQRQVGIRVNSDRLVAAVGKYGVVPRKTMIAVAHEQLAGNRHFWRGCVDGDGMVKAGVTGGYFRPTMSFVSASKTFAEQFAAFCEPIIPADDCQVYASKPKASDRSHHTTMYSVSLANKNAAAVLSQLYLPGDIAIPRKAEAAKAIRDYYEAKAAYLSSFVCPTPGCGKDKHFQGGLCASCFQKSWRSKKRG